MHKNVKRMSAQESVISVNNELLLYDAASLNTFQLIPDLVLLIDDKGKISYINHSAYGYFTNDILGENFEIIFGDDFIEKAREIKNKVINKRNQCTFEFSDKQNKKWYSGSLSLIDKQKKSKQLIFIIREISKLKYTEPIDSVDFGLGRDIFELVQAIVLVLDAKGRILTMNPFMEKITGYNLAQVKGKDWFATFIPKEERSSIKQVFNEVVEGNPIARNVNSVISKDGKLLEIEWYAKDLRDRQGNIFGILSFGQEISERIQVEQALKTQETKLNVAMKIAKLAMWEMDFANNKFVFNDGFYSLFGTDVSKVGSYKLSLDEYLERFVYPEDRQNIVNEIMAAATNPVIPDNFEMKHRILYANGSIGYLAVRLIFVKDNSNRLISMIGVNQDITEYELAEQALKISKAHLSNAVKIARLGYWEFDVAANIFTFNDHFYSIFHTTAEKEGGYTMTPENYANKFLHPDDRWLVIEETKKALSTNDPNYSRQIEHRIFYADGKPGNILVRIFVRLDNNGKVIKTYGANQDITERIEFEKKLKEQNHQYLALNDKLKKSLKQLHTINRELERAKQKAEESDKLKSAFLANMSHEIRTPMNGIIGFSKMMSRPNLSDERKNQYSEIVNDLCRQLLHLIDDILDISKIETGQLAIQKSEFNLNDLLFGLYSVYKKPTDEHNINLFLRKSLPDKFATIKTDNKKLRQILDNLLSNALKFTHKGHISFGYDTSDNSIRFFVEDTGIGISDDIKENIFERFWQAQSDVSKSYGGTGLGLSISKAYIEKLGGKITVKSTVDEGSVFSFTLPISCLKKHKESKDAFIQPEDYRSRPKILIVEDEDANYLFLEEVLIELEVELLHAKNASEAIQLCRDNNDLSLVLMDLKLPDFDGYEALNRIREFLPFLPAIAQTAYAMSGDREKALSAGFIDYIAKPIDHVELVNKVKLFVQV